MTGGGGRDDGAAGGPARHVPVLREEVLSALGLPRDGKSAEPGLYLDGTFGAGGYACAILHNQGTRLLALDRDPSAVAGGGYLVDKFAERLILVEARFGELEAVAARQKLGPFDGVALDIGVSSMQIDEAARGFSFRQDGPLDMRMGKSGRSAADIVNTAPEAALADIFYHYGEERLSRRIARAIVLDRETKQPFLTTRPLAEMIARIVPHKPTDIHPATRVFQALRIVVNDELGELVAGLAAAERVLKPGGRLAVVTFHSLEDRIVKQFFARRSGKGVVAGRRLPGEPEPIPASFSLPRGQPMMPGADESAANPRARSAKLRFAIRTDQPAIPIDPSLLDLSLLPAGAAKPAKSQLGKSQPGKSR